MNKLKLDTDIFNQPRIFDSVVQMVFFRKYRWCYCNRIPYPRALKALKPSEGYIISNGRIAGIKI